MQNAECRMHNAELARVILGEDERKRREHYFLTDFD